MKEAYPVFIKQSGDDFLVYVPDMEVYTEGKSIIDAIEMARDAIGLKGVAIEDGKEELPVVSTFKQARNKAIKDADEDFDYSDGILTLVDVDFIEYRKKVDNRAVKKNCTIPYWLSVEAEKAHVNVSKILKEALIAELGLTKENDLRTI